MTTERRRRPAVAPASRVLATGSAVAATLLLVGAMAEHPDEATPAASVVPNAAAVPVTVTSASTSASTIRISVPVPAATPAAPTPVPVTASHGSR